MGLQKPRFRIHIYVACILLLTISAWLVFPDHLRSVHDSIGHVIASVSSAKPDPYAPLDKEKFNDLKWSFQFDIDLPLPAFDTNQLKTYTPTNWRGRGYPTYSLFFATRNATIHDPYFSAVMQIIYRLLWDPRSKSRLHPVTVYVAPFVSDLHKDYFKAAGAIVREVDMHLFTPTAGHTLDNRLADVMAKLDLWADEQYSLSVYLDADAFPITNIDSLFTTDLAMPQICKRDLLPEEYKRHADEFCDYVFSAVEDATGLNAGVMVLKPNRHLHSMLFRFSEKQEDYDQGFPEQSVLYHVYNNEGPLPWHKISHSYNGFLDVAMNKEADVFVIHSKLWDPWLFNATGGMFGKNWQEMLDLYESPRFAELRAGNGTDLSAHGRVRDV